MLNKALKKAKREGDTKVSVTFQVNSELKKEFEKLCKDEGVSMTAMLAALMETAIEEKKNGDMYSSIASYLGNQLSKMTHELSELEQFAHDPQDYHAIDNYKDEINRLRMMKNYLEGES